jgi:hypothetical protein
MVLIQIYLPPKPARFPLLGYFPKSLLQKANSIKLPLKTEFTKGCMLRDQTCQHIAGSKKKSSTLFKRGEKII